MDDLTSWGAYGPDVGGARGGHGRRDFLKKAGIGAAAAWTAPIILSTEAAHAQGTTLMVTFVKEESGEAAGTADLVINNPATASGDRLLAFIATDSATVPPLTADGWNQLASQDTTGSPNDVRSFLYERTATGPGGQFTFGRGTGTGTFRGVIVAYHGVAAIGDQSGTPDTTDVPTHTFANVTTTADNNMIVRFGALGAGTSTWDDPGPTVENRVNTGGDRSILVFDSVLLSAGTAGAAAVGSSAPDTRAALHTVALSPT
jgi:hypothetical protein